MGVEPVPGEPAAVVDCDSERALVVADYHAGIEVGLRYEGVELDSRADERRERLLALLDRTLPDRLVLLGDVGDAIGEGSDEERAELAALFAAVPDDVAVTVVPGNHDGAVEAVAGDDVAVTPSHGVRIGDVGFLHGHTWPSPAVIEADVVCTAHEHPVVRLEDTVGGARKERAWLRGSLAADPFEAFHDRDLAIVGELVVFPAFNDRSGGTWVNVEGQTFLSPFLPDGLAGGEAYLLDGTRLGDYRRV
jgi:metallophosphoesterase superfamily enzyme